MREFVLGSTFADHVIRGVAGRGGMGVVYRAMHIPLKREVALKVIAPEVSSDAEFRVRFRHELEAAAAIEHANAVPVYHAGEEDGLLFVTMRYVEGMDLARLLAIEKRLDPSRAVSVIAQVADALDAAHRLGVVHRDVKPGNVLIEGEGEATHALLTDFGLTKKLESETNVTQPGAVVGTFDYTAPEQLQDGTIDARTDVYALGCMLYQLVTGDVPFPRTSAAAKLFAHISAPPPSVTAVVPGAPASLDEVVQRAMAKDPDGRYPSAGELGRAALAAVGRRVPARAEPSTGRSDEERAAVAAAEAAVVPLPPALIGELDLGRFVGRADAVRQLRARCSLAASGQRQFVLISGEPGIGKTRLAAELAGQVHATGAIVLYGRSDAESLVPYQPFIAAMQHYIAHRQRLEFPAELELELSELARFVPALRGRVPVVRDPIAEEPETRRYRLFEAVARVLAFVSREHPTVVILDDLQWADTSTVLLLGHVLADVEPAKVLIVGTVRDAEQWRCAELARLIARQPGERSFARIPLSGLDGSETRALVAAYAPRAIGDAFAERLRDETEGNPFFINETLRSLTEVFEADTDDAALEHALTSIAAPEGVRELVERRLSQLSERANQLLSVAAVVGRQFPLEVLEALLEEPAERIISTLEEVSAAGLVREVEEDVDCFLFSQALVREALYAQQIASRRVRQHHRIAQSLESLAARMPVHPGELAYHFFESRHLDREGKAIDYAAQAGEQAAASLAYEAAVGYYRRALNALASRSPTDARRTCELLLELGAVEVRAADPAARETFARAADLAQREAFKDHLARAALGFAGRYAQAGVIDQDAIALLEEALETFGRHDSGLAVKLLARLANSLHFAGNPERTDALSRSALEMARRVGDSDALVIALECRHIALFDVEHLDDRLRLNEELLALAERVGERELEAVGRHWRIYDLIEAADIDAARREHRALTQLADELRQPIYQHFAALWKVVWAQMADDDDVQPLARRAYELGQLGQARAADTHYGAQLLAMAYRDRRLAAYVPTIAAMVAQHPTLVVYRALLTLAHLHAGDRDAGVGEFDRLAQDHFSVVPRDIMAFGAFCLLAEACALIGDTARAAVLYETLLPHRSRFVQVGVVTCLGSTERFLGLLAVARSDWDAANAHFEAALAANTASGLTSMARVTRRDHADMLLAQGLPEQTGQTSDGTPHCAGMTGHE